MNRRTQAPLDDAQHQTLLNMVRFRPKPRLRERAQACLLATKHYCVKQIANILQRSERSVSTWLDDFEKHGFLGLYDDTIPGRPPTLNQEQRKQLQARLVHVTPGTSRAIGH